MKPSDVYREKSIEGADMRVYYSGLGKEVAFLDEEFYKEKGISTNSVMQLGIHITPVEEGPRIGNGIKAVGDFRPYLEINFLRKNIEYIQDHTNSDLAKKKSACILKIALANATKLAGRVIVGTDDSFETKEGICNALKQLRSDDWLYTDGTLQYIEDISKNQLDKKIYQEIGLSQYSDECRLLGFSADETEIVIDGIDVLALYIADDQAAVSRCKERALVVDGMAAGSVDGQSRTLGQGHAVLIGPALSAVDRYGITGGILDLHQPGTTIDAVDQNCFGWRAGTTDARHQNRS